MNIKVLEESQKEKLEALKAKAWPVADLEHYGVNQPRFFNETFTLTVEEEGEFVGYITVICDSGVAQIEPLMVDPDKKGQGVGTALLREAEKLAKEKNIHKLWLETGVDWKAKEFYIKHEYNVRAELPNHIGGKTFILMDKFI